MAMMDDAWLAEPPKRSRLRLALVLLLAAAVLFLGGVEVQKRYGAPEAAATPVAAMPAGGFPQREAVAATDATATAVIGTVVSIVDGVWTVEDLGGTTHTITVDEDVRIVRESPLTAEDVAPGDTVDITDTTVTVR